MKDSIDNTPIAPNTGKKVRKKARDLTVEDFYFLKIGNMWRYMRTQHFSFWMICCYIFFEYTRPQAIFPSIDILPWAQMFILMAMAGAVLDPTVRWVSSPMNWLMNIFAILIFLSSIYAVYPEVSKEHYIDFYSWFVVYYLIINIINTRERFYIFMLIILISSAKIAIGTAKAWVLRGFSFTKWGLMGPPGYFQNSGELAILMLMTFPLSYYLYVYLKPRISKWEKIVLVVFWVSPVLTILGASSRGAQVGLVIQLLIMFRKKIFRVKQLAAVLVLLVGIYNLLPDEQKERFEAAGSDKTSIQRLLYWKHGLEMINDHPVLGVGFFNFPPYYEKYFSADMLYQRAQLPHNILIQVGTDLGLLGLTVYVFMLVMPFLLQSKMKNVKSIISVIVLGVNVGLVGFIVAGQFVTVAYYPFFWVGSGIVVAGLNLVRFEKNGVH